jgi:hypothetical protein
MSGRVGLYACMLGGTVLIAGPTIAGEVNGSATDAKHCYTGGRSAGDFAAALNDNPNASPQTDDSN